MAGQLDTFLDITPVWDAKRAAMKAYRRLHRSCLRMITDGGLYLAASCSSQARP